MIYPVIDVETTDYRGEVIQLACVLLDLNIEKMEFKKLGEFNEYCRPTSKIYWNEDSKKAHGMSWEETQAFQEQKEMTINFMRFLAPYRDQFPLTFVSHDKRDFDFNHVENLFRFNGFQYSFWRCFNNHKKVSTIDLAKEKGIPVDGYSLPILCEYFRIELESHHNAIFDARACAEIFIKLSIMEFYYGSLFELR